MLPTSGDSHLRQSTTVGRPIIQSSAPPSNDPEFDRIIDSPSRAELLSPEFASSPAGDPRHGPIPANRVALLREIAERQTQAERRQWWKDAAYRLCVVAVFILVVLLLTMALWMAFLAGLRTSIAGTGGKPTTTELRISPFPTTIGHPTNYTDPKSGTFPIMSVSIKPNGVTKSSPSNSHVAIMPRKMPHKRSQKQWVSFNSLN